MGVGIPYGYLLNLQSSEVGTLYLNDLDHYMGVGIPYGCLLNLQSSEVGTLNLWNQYMVITLLALSSYRYHLNQYHFNLGDN